MTVQIAEYFAETHLGGSLRRHFPQQVMKAIRPLYQAFGGSFAQTNRGSQIGDYYDVFLH
jgi:hypothetical protein